MKARILSSILLTSIVLSVIVFAALAGNPNEITDNVSFGSNLNKTVIQILTITNNATTNISGTVTADVFSYSASSLFASTGLTIIFNPLSITIPASLTNTTESRITVPFNAYMGTYSTTLTIGTETFPLNIAVKSSDYSKNLRINEDDTTWPDSIRVGSNFVIKSKNNFIENRGSADADNVIVEAWLYDNTNKKIVSKDSFNQGQVKDKDEEEFDTDLELDTEGLDSSHSYTFYIRAYDIDNPENFFVEKQIDSVDLKAEDELCEVGNMDMNDLNEDDIEFHGDEISPGEKIIVPITVENTGSDTLNDVVVRVWICEDNSDCTWDDSHLDDYKVSKLDAKAIAEDEAVTFNAELEIDKDTNEGKYRLRAEAYEKSDEDQNCIGQDLSIDIKKESEELILENVNIPDMIACGENFNVEAKVTNIGEDDLNDIVVRVRETSGKVGINELSKASDINEGDSERYSFNLKMPTSINEGEYTMVIEASNEDEDSVLKTIQVRGDCIVTPKTSIAASLESDAIAGQQIIIKATLKNLGEEKVIYTLTASGNEAWSTLSKIDPATLSLDAGETDSALIYLDTTKDSAGERTFSIQAVSEGEVKEQPVSLTIQPAAGIGFTGASIFENIKGNWFIWVIVVINIILIVAIIIVASRLSR